MIPQYIRFLLPSNKNIQVLVPSQQPILQGLRYATPPPMCPSSATDSLTQPSAPQLLLHSNSLTASSSFASNIEQRLSNKISSSSKSNASTPIDEAAATQTVVNPSLPDINSCEMISPTTPVSSKRNRSCSSNISTTDQKKSEIVVENNENSQKKLKRAKNLSEEDTSTFISVWSEYYDRLSAGGSRNMPLYHSMAQQLNDLLSSRVMTAADVKSKIFNLVAEYRKRKKEQGKTGGSPCMWRYFDQIDKLLGERPYNDDSLLVDTMMVQDDANIDNIENIPVNYSTVSSLEGEGIDVVPGSTKDTEEAAKDVRLTATVNSSNVSPNQNVNVQCGANASVKKCSSRRKKKISDIRFDLMQQTINNINSSNELVNQTELKSLALLEKQTKLQEESLNNEKEFLNVFKIIMNNYNQKD